MRDTTEALHTCPVCGTEGPVVGLRDYSTWLFDLLPGRAGASDVDAVIEQHNSGRALALEFKPSKYVPRGQGLLFDRLCACGFDVWVVVDKDFEEDQLTMCIWQPEQMTQTWKSVTVNEFREAVRAWWRAGEEEAA